MKRLLAAAMLAIPSVASAQTMPPPIVSGMSCFVGASAGGAVSKTSAPGVTIAADGAIGGVEAGCDYLLGQWKVGALGRVDFSDVSGTIGDGKVRQDPTWTAAATVGYHIVNPGIWVYGLAGMSGTNFNYAQTVDIDRNGVVLGAGLELKLFDAAPRLFVEFDHTMYAKWSNGLTGESLKPSTDAVRVGLRYRF